MAGKPIADSGPEPAAESASSASAAPAVEERSRERFGPLEVRRLVKDDGRALLVYGLCENADGTPAEDRDP